MKFGIDKGHNIEYDTGAGGIRYEDNLTKEVGDKVISKLRGLGHTVIDCTPLTASSLGDSLWQRCNTANSNNVDEFISIHFNLGGGKGTEVYAMSGVGREIAQNVLEQIVSLGYANRGVKDGRHLYVIRNTNAPAILIECAFLDSVEDMRKYNDESMADAIVRGLTRGRTVLNPEQNTNPPRNNDILNLQIILNRLNIKDDSGKVLVEDGIQGNRSTEAIKRFQSIVGIQIDGIAGPVTHGAITFILQKPQLSIGSTGMAVRYIQYRVGTSIDGIFGNLTKNAVARYQNSNGLSPDGIIGNNTWESLIG